MVDWPSEIEEEHTWRTREDPFAEVWEEVRKNLKINPGLEAKTLFEDLQRRYPGRFADGQLRTLQRAVKQLAPADCKITLCAVDGGKTDDVISQLRNIPEGASHLVLSVGGNDALAHSYLLSDTTTPGMQILEYLALAASGFEMSYRKLIKKILNLRLPLVVFTIYNGNLEPPFVRAARAAVAVFNDKIYQVAGEYSVPVLELRRICNDPSDYANLIEPSSSGGKKIAASILRHVQSLME